MRAESSSFRVLRKLRWRGRERARDRLPSVRVLVVEDDAELRAAIIRDTRVWPTRVLAGVASVEIDEAEDEASAIALLSNEPALVVLDVSLRPGNGIAVVDAARSLRPVPVFVAISGTASAAEGFALAERGVRAYLSKPFTTDELRETVRRALQSEPDPAPDAAALVGIHTLHTVQDRVRKEMLEDALARTDWNYAQSARLLGVTRQAIQQMVRRFELEPKERESG